MNRRELTLSTKFAAEEDGTVSGMAWPFGGADRVGDVIEPGSFKGAKTPLPMLYGHDQREVIGKWTVVREDAQGLHVAGRLNLKVQRAQEVRELLKAGDITGLSIGFIPKDYAPRDGGGWTISKAELLEVSVVAVPANPGATVTHVKSHEEPDMNELAKLRDDVVRLRADVVKMKNTPEIKPAADTKALELALSASTALEALDKRLDGIELKAGRPVFSATPERPVSAVDKAASIVHALLKNHAEPSKSVFKHLEDDGHKALAVELERTERINKALNASAAVAGGILVPSDVSSEIVEILRPRTAFLRGNPIRVPMPSGAFTMPAGATGATASYTTEGNPSDVTEQTFQEINLDAKTLSAVIPVTNDLLAYGIAGTRDFVMRDLTSALSQTMDLNAFIGNGVGGNPLGIFKQAGITSYTALSNTNAPTITQVDTELRRLINALVAANVNLASAAWVIPATTLGYLADVRTGNGDSVYDVDGTNPRLKNIPVLSTTNLPTNLGTGGDETSIALVAFDNVVMGESKPLELAVSNQASLVVNGTVISLFQRRMTAVLAIMQHDFALRQTGAVAVSNGIRWGK